MKVKFVYLNLLGLIVLYLLELKHLLYHYTNLLEHFFDEIGFNHIRFDHMRPKHQLNMDEITVYHNIIKKELFGKNKVYNIKKRAI